MSLTRRQFLRFSAGTGLAGPLLGVPMSGLSLPGLTLLGLPIAGCQSAPTVAAPIEYDLFAAPASLPILPDQPTSGLGFNGGLPAPVLRGKQGQPMRIRLHNQLNEPTTVHWHGLRIPVNMDGVPGASQQPVPPGETFTYEFSPPDAGTFWYHPHMNSIEQMGRGLTGGLIIEEADAPGFDQDLFLLIRNWQLNTDGSFGPLSIKRYAARQGTPGQTFTVNGSARAEFRIPAGASTRIRLANADNTWHYDLALAGADAQLLALDAHPVTPRSFEGYQLGPGMRMDLGLIAPTTPGSTFFLKHRQQILARFVVDTPIGTARTALPALPPNPVSEPDLAHAEPYFFSFEWDAATDQQGRSLFWNLKGPKAQRPAYCTNANVLASLEFGKSYIFSMRNNTQYPHPIHLHGHAFKVLDSNKRSIIPHFADTAVLQGHEQMRIAFVADNPGAWMFHCHVIEHMAMGLAGMLVVV